MNEKDAFLAQADVSRETLAHLEAYADLLKTWNARINLVSPKSLELLWSRHFLDSLQLLRIAPDWASWADLGSGGGFPGAVIAIANPDRQVVLVESDARKKRISQDRGARNHGFSGYYSTN